MKALEITKENFETEVLKSEKPVLVDFWAAWCGPCRMIAPIIEELASEVTFAKVAKVDVVKEEKLAEEYGIMSIPTLLIFKGGKVVKTLNGLRPKDELLNNLKEFE